MKKLGMTSFRAFSYAINQDFVNIYDSFISSAFPQAKLALWQMFLLTQPFSLSLLVFSLMTFKKVVCHINA